MTRSPNLRKLEYKTAPPINCRLQIWWQCKEVGVSAYNRWAGLSCRTNTTTASDCQTPIAEWSNSRRWAWPREY